MNNYDNTKDQNYVQVSKGKHPHFVTQKARTEELEATMQLLAISQ